MGLLDMIRGIDKRFPINEERKTFTVGYERDGKEYSWNAKANSDSEARRQFEDYMEGNGTEKGEYRIKGVYASTADDDIEESEDIVTEENSTGNLDGGEGQIRTPNAFQRKNPSRSDKAKEDKNATSSTGYNITKKTNNYIQRRDEIFGRASELIEGRYTDYAGDETKSATHKINDSIREVNRRLYEIERMVDHAARLKSESGLDNVYWKPTKQKFLKISERMLRIGTKLREMNS